MSSTTTGSAGEAKGTTGESRAFRGLALVFVLTFVNLLGLMLAIATLGGLGEWSRWQFVGLFGVIEGAAGLSNILAPNIWHLPAAELQTPRRTRVRLAASALLIPHWGGGARAAAGICCIVAAGFGERWSAESLLLLPLLALLVVFFLGVSAAIARFGVAYPALDIVQFTVLWRDRESKLSPLSLSASVQQLILGILTLPAVKTLAPGALYGPAIRPSLALLGGVAIATLLTLALTVLLWAGRMGWRAPSAQQQEAETNA